MKVKVDKNKCIGCGACESICPEVFVLKNEKATAKKATTNSQCAKKAADACPVKAIGIS